jgi:hypothetical protein
MATIAFNQFINPVAIDAIGWLYYLVYCGWLIFELGFIITFLIETKGLLHSITFILIITNLCGFLGRTLEETSALFDGEQQPDNLMAMGGEAAAMMTRKTFVNLDRKYSPNTEESYELRSKPQQHQDSAFLGF